jgi:hypothetical protein
MKHFYILYLLLVILFVKGCAPIIVMGPSYPQEQPREHYSINIPKGHLPPPGHCRIWYPNKPAGHQPPPQRCPIPLNQIPLGAYVVSRVDGDSKRCMVKVYHEQRPGVVVDIHYLNMADN